MSHLYKLIDLTFLRAIHLYFGSRTPMLCRGWSNLTHTFEHDQALKCGSRQCSMTITLCRSRVFRTSEGRLAMHSRIWHQGGQYVRNIVGKSLLFVFIHTSPLPLEVHSMRIELTMQCKLVAGVLYSVHTSHCFSIQYNTSSRVSDAAKTDTLANRWRKTHPSQQSYRAWLRIVASASGLRFLTKIGISQGKSAGTRVSDLRHRAVLLWSTYSIALYLPNLDISLLL